MPSRISAGTPSSQAVQNNRSSQATTSSCEAKSTSSVRIAAYPITDTMNIEDLAALAKEGFAGVHERLDALNGRTRKTETGLAELGVLSKQLAEASLDKEARLRSVETRTAISAAYLKDLKGASKREGVKWGGIVSVGMSVLMYLASHFLGIPAPKP